MLLKVESSTPSPNSNGGREHRDIASISPAEGHLSVPTTVPRGGRTPTSLQPQPFSQYTEDATECLSLSSLRSVRMGKLEEGALFGNVRNDLSIAGDEYQLGNERCNAECLCA